MKKHILALSIIASLAACSPAEKQEPTAQTKKQPTLEKEASDKAGVAPVEKNEGQAKAVDKQETVVKVYDEKLNAEFTKFTADLIEQFWQKNPGYAVYVGYYKYDDQLSIPDAAGLAAEIAFTKEQLALLQAFDVKELTPNNASDYYILQNQMQSSLFNVEELKSHQWNPSIYNIAGVFGVILNTDYKAKDERLRTIFKRMEFVPEYYQAAKANITTPTITHTKLAIQQNQGALGLFTGAVHAAMSESNLTTQEKTDFNFRIAKTTSAIKDYIAWLEDKLKQLEASNSGKDFRIGEALYEKKFALDIYSSLTAKQLFDKAEQEKDRIHGEMSKLADKLWPKYFADKEMPKNKLVAIKALIDHISVKHVERENFVASIKAQIPELEKFVSEKNLLEMDANKPLVVRETPKYQRGFAGASINAPGPYDAGANTYYNVTPLDAFDDEQAESYLREYNHWILQILNIHEAVPGHYTQLVHSNKSKSLVKSIFGNGAMVEGWAVYTERMMLEEGYGEFEPELWLMYYKWNLRVIMNSIIDYSIQVKGLSEQGALDLMMNQAFQEEAEARGKWRRATLSQVQLTSYFTGYSEIYALREELKAKLGDKFNLTDFHNQFLSYGSAPVPIIRKMMLDTNSIN
ncbi:DUF885 domain-containing protein [Thalassomonas sp. M1454]|uniref:DUF885 domain-containing protein n=1 Tax=Thalassomonas sp. M1454 TaxID=2594477 RepID=UPI00117E3CAE|nr:DUF885 domain-containing protein [Thalassomonas sp. M1454]TRX55865.1 DUF885 domain-containing protein [Thalassomonas sp. M1454]